MSHACAVTAGMGDGYEYSEPVTVSAITGTVKLPSPYNTECEYSVHAVSFGDAGGVTISTDTAPPAASATFTTGGEYGYRGRVYVAPAAGFFPMASSWTKLAGNFLYFNVTVATSKSASIVIQFRRRLPAMQLVPHMEGAEFSSEHTGAHGQNIGGASHDNGRLRQSIDQNADGGRGVRTR